MSDFENNNTAEGAQSEEQCACKKETARSEECKKLLENRLNRIIGQLGGIKRMLGEDRYCYDVLVQLSAAQSALKNLGYIILKDHLQTCVSEKIKRGDEDIIEETLDLIKKLK